MSLPPDNPTSAGRTATATSPTTVRDILAFRRVLSAWPGEWRAEGVASLNYRAVVLDEEGGLVCRCPALALADLIVTMHNTWLPLCNAWYLGRKTLRDREAVIKLLEKEDGDKSV